MAGAIAISLAFLLFSTVTTAQDDGAPRVTLPGGGILKGVTLPFNESEFLNIDTHVNAFLGVPYAQPPVGNLRFRDPLPYNISGEYNATEHRAECPQATPLAQLPTIGPILARDVDEDCLFLSIYTPSPTPTSNVPVFFWIHGGGYSLGAGSWVVYEPLPMVALADIVVVAVNYRLGAYGYLTSGDDVAPGNYGMMDQILALRWVQDNIAAFGGDPNRVTIGGESAGGSSVSLLSLSPLTDGLFHQTIMQSGTALSPWSWTTMESGAEAARDLAASLRCQTTSSAQMISCLRQVPQANLTDASNGASYVLSSPVVDGRFLPDAPMELINRRQFKVTPTLIGTNEDEGSSQALFLFPQDLLSDTPPVMNLSFFRSILQENTYRVSSEIELASIDHHYVDWTVADDPSGDQLDSYIRLVTDVNFACPTEYLARALEAAGASIYRYEMTHDPSWSIYVGVPKWLGAAHAEELQYVFSWGFIPTIARIVGQTDEEKVMSVQFMRYWTNFIKSGNPNAPLQNDIYPEWPLYTMPEQNYKQLSLNMTNGRAMRAASCSFMMNFIPGLRIQTDPIEDVYTDWQNQYQRWKGTDMPEWTTEFNEYKNENSCTASP
ncbi:acetylcholinesterase-like [Diadema antillarum]|uniref:acetylcholinesterase-like n=1 Tax=Diadema antillarum TaxID=105358 RepID=UPI003A89DC69